jgi:hypothetical protein
MTEFIEHFFKITINYSAITIHHNTLRHAPLSSLYSQLLNSKRPSLSLIKLSARTTHRKHSPSIIV